MTPNYSALPASSFRRVLIALVTFSLLAVTLAAPVLGAKGGNSAASAACENGGYLNWTTSTGAAFKNEGACVKYAAMGNALVAVNPFSISYRAGSSAGLFGYTATGSGLVPGTSNMVLLDYATGQTVNGGQATVDSNGNWLVSRENAECVDFGIRPLLGVRVALNQNFATTYPLPFPAAFCTPPA